MNSSTSSRHKKSSLTRGARARRFLASCVDPRAYLHMLRLLNYYNYTHVAPRRAISLGKAVALSPTASFANADRISIGDRTHIGSHCTLWAGPGHGHIKIGPDCLLGPGVFVTAANYRFRDGSPVTTQSMEESDVQIGADVWIGVGAIILPGVSIGAGAVIGAGCVVTRSVPAGSVMAGPSADIIGTRFRADLAA